MRRRTRGEACGHELQLDSGHIASTPWCVLYWIAQDLRYSTICRLTRSLLTSFRHLHAVLQATSSFNGHRRLAHFAWLSLWPVGARTAHIQTSPFSTALTSPGQPAGRSQSKRLAVPSSTQVLTVADSGFVALKCISLHTRRLRVSYAQIDRYDGAGYDGDDDKERGNGR